MSDFGRAGPTTQDPERRRSGGSRFGDLSDRLARTFGSFERTTELPQWEPEAEPEYPEPVAPWERSVARFPVARSGYDRTSVDEHLAALERELAELRDHRDGAVAIEIQRIGEQTAKILRVAHEQAQEITRKAHEQADRCLSDAAANAVSITEEANERLRRLDAETDSVWQERGRLLEDARAVGTQLVSLVEEASERFPGEVEKSGHHPTPVAADCEDVTAPVAPAAGEAFAEFEPEFEEDVEDNDGPESAPTD